MVEDLMEISRLDAGKEAVRVEPVDIGSLVRQILRARGWEARVQVRGDDVVIQTDRRRIERIVANLVGNALEHGGGNVRVTVGVDSGPDPGQVRVEVADRGSGIAPDHLQHLFDRFYKADPSRSTPGSGLGLGIAMENARLLGGDIRVQSELGVGSTFTLILPVTEPLPGGEPRVSWEIDDRRTSTKREI
jgi:signal transduction histidine kinase